MRPTKATDAVERLFSRPLRRVAGLAAERNSGPQKELKSARQVDQDKHVCQRFKGREAGSKLSELSAAV
jgi:hypothetical protein